MSPSSFSFPLHTSHGSCIGFSGRTPIGHGWCPSSSLSACKLRLYAAADANPDTTSHAQQQQQHQEGGAISVEQRKASTPPLSHRSQPSISSLIDYWDPFNFGTSLRQMIDKIDQLFLMPSMGLEAPYVRSPWDVMEDDEFYCMRIDLPGFKKDEVKIQVEERVLVVNAEHKEEASKDKWRTRTHGKYHTRIALPETIDLSKISAKLDNGVLDISIPKARKAKQVMNVAVH